jgi:RNA polymerase-binding protein DksA
MSNKDDKKVKLQKKQPPKHRRIEAEPEISEEKITKITLGKSKLSPEETENFRQLLLNKREELIGDMDVMTEDSLRKSHSESSGDLSYMPIHMADIGSDNYDQEFTVGLIKTERNLIREVDDALRRIEKGTYGICIATGKPIPKTRLKFKPWAKYSIEYIREMEKKAKR